MAEPAEFSNNPRTNVQLKRDVTRLMTQNEALREEAQVFKNTVTELTASVNALLSREAIKPNAENAEQPAAPAGPALDPVIAWLVERDKIKGIANPLNLGNHQVVAHPLMLAVYLMAKPPQPGQMRTQDGIEGPLLITLRESLRRSCGEHGFRTR
jgi:hypothetical protein